MANRTGTYVAFHAKGTTDPTASDIRYYNMMKAWKEHGEIDFTFSNSHERTPAVRDSSARATLLSRLRERLNLSKHLLLIMTADTRLDGDNVPFEIEYAIDTCKIPLIVAYPGYGSICAPKELSGLWPAALATRINSGSAKAIHVAFARDPVKAAIDQFNISNQPTGSLVYYAHDAYKRWGLV